MISNINNLIKGEDNDEGINYDENLMNLFNKNDTDNNESFNNKNNYL